MKRGESVVGVERERKYLTRDDSWRQEVSRFERISQGYLSTEVQRSVRVRLVSEHAFLTVKGPRREDRRTEFDYPIPREDAARMLEDLCSDRVEKTRYWLDRTPGQWCVDVFHGSNQGLVLAEVEFGVADPVPMTPSWVVRDVTDDDSFSNTVLARFPYRTWGPPGER